VKVSFTWARTVVGYTWVGKGLAAHAALMIGGGLALWYSRSRGARVWVPATTAAVWVAYVGWVGGDIFPAWRQLVPAVPLLGLLIAEGAQRVRWTQPVVGLAVGLFALHIGQGVLNKGFDRARMERWEWDGLSLGTTLKRAFGDKRPLLAVDAAGALPFWSELPAVDMLGLTDAWLAANKPKRGYGTGGIGHDLGNGAYIWDRKPDIIAFRSAGGAPEPAFKSGKQLLRQRGWKRTYQRLRLTGATHNRATGLYFFRREDGPLAAKRSDDRIEIPGYYLAYQGASAVLGTGGKLLGRVGSAPANAGLVPHFRVGRGRWAVSTEPEAPVRFDVRCRDVSATVLSPGDVVLEIAEEVPIDLFALSTDPKKPALVRSIVLTRVGGEPTQRCAESVGRVLASVPKEPPAPTSMWDAADRVVFDGQGLTVLLPEAAAVTGLSLSLDWNDTIDVHWMLGRTRVGRSVIEPKPGSRLAVHELAAPPSVAGKQIDRVTLLPREGDGAYSLGHLAVRRAQGSR
jgi:hypothetical protein